MTSSVHFEQPPSYQQVLSASQEHLYKNHAPFNPPVPTAPVISTTTTIRFTDRPVMMHCPYCQQLITTVIEEENGAVTYLLCILISLLGCFLGCCFIPFCISEVKDKIHICPRCQKTVGKKRLL